MCCLTVSRCACIVGLANPLDINPLDISPLNLRIVLVKQVDPGLRRCIFLNILTLLRPLTLPGA